MTQKLYKVGLKIDGDATGGVKSLQLTARQMDKLVQSQAKAARKSNQFAEALKGAGHKMALWTVSLGSAGAVLGKFIGYIGETDQIGKLSDRIGASTEALSEYKHVAELTGVSFNTLTTAWQRQTRRVAEAAKGTGEAKDALKELNVSATDLARLAPEEQFEILATALDGVANQGDRVRLAMKLWDTEGVALLQTTKGGAESIKAMREEAKELGLSLGSEQVDNVEAFNDTLTRFGNMIKGTFLPAMTAAAGSVVDLVEAFTGNWDRIVKAGETLGEVVLAGAAAFTPFGLAVMGATGKTSTFLKGLKGLRAFILTSMLSPVTALNTALFGTSVSATAATGAIGKLKVAGGLLFAAFAGGKIGTYLRDQFVEVRVAGLAVIGVLMKGWERLKQGLKNIFAVIRYAWNQTLDGIKKTFAGFLSFTATALDKLPGMGDTASQMQQYAASLKPAKSALQKLTETVRENNKAYAEASKAIDENIQSLVDYELNNDAAGDSAEKTAEKVEKLGKSTKKSSNEVTGLGKSADKSSEGVTKLGNALAASGVQDFAKKFEQLRKSLDPAYARTVDYRKELGILKEAHAKNLITLSDYTSLLGLLDAKYKEAKDSTDNLTTSTKTASEAVDTMKDKAGPFATAWENATRRIDESFAKAWEGAFDSFGDFTDSILDSYKKMIAEMAHQQITRPLFQNLTGGTGAGSGLFTGLFSGGRANNVRFGKGGQVPPVEADPALGQTGFFSSPMMGALAVGGGALLGSAFGGEYSSEASSVGSLLGSAFLGPLGGFLGGIGGGLLGKFIGGGPSDLTQSITVGANRLEQGGLTGDRFSQENRNIADAAGEMVSSMFAALESKTGHALTNEYNINVGSRDGFDLYKNGIALIEDKQGKVTEILDVVFDDMLNSAGVFAQSYKDLQLDGETLAQTLVRVDAQFSVVSTAADKLGLHFDLIGDQGLNAADALVQMAGGLDAFVAKSDYFYNNFYTEQERLGMSIENYSLLLSDFNEQFGTNITTTQGLRDFADSLDLTTDAGQEAFAAVLDLAPALVELGEAQKRLAEITGETTNQTEQQAEATDVTVDSLSILDQAADSASENMTMLGDDIEQMGAALETASEEMVQLTRNANDFAGRMARDALLAGLSGQDKDLFLLNEWRQKAVDELKSFTDQGVEILGGPEKVLSDIEKIYGIRLSEINERYQEVVDTTDNLIAKNVELVDYDKMRADAISEVTAAYERESGALESFAAQMADFASDLRGYGDSLLLGDLSTLNPQEQYAEARKQFEEIARRAKLGDQDAMGRFKDAGNTFLKESREYQGSAGSYARDFESVRSAINTTATLAERQKDNADKQLEQMKKQVEEVVGLKEEVKTLKEAIVILTQVEQEAGSQTVVELRKQTSTLGDLKSNSDLGVASL